MGTNPTHQAILLKYANPASKSRGKGAFATQVPPSKSRNAMRLQWRNKRGHQRLSPGKFWREYNGSETGMQPMLAKCTRIWCVRPVIGLASTKEKIVASGPWSVAN